jgi:hypothetical protein
MKVKALKLFGDGKRLYKEGEVIDTTKEWVDKINSTPNAPLVEDIEESQAKSEGADINGYSNGTKPGKGKTGNKHSS